MTMPFAGSAGAAADDPTVADVDVGLWSRDVARTILPYAMVVGIAADALLRQGPRGIGFPAWIAVGVLAATSLTWRSGRAVNAEAGAWLATALAFSLGLAWRDAAMLQFLDLVATFGALTMAAIALNNRRAALFAERLRDTLWAAAAVVRNEIAGMVPLVLRDVGAPDLASRMTPRGWPLVRAALIAGALIVLFGTLLRDADPLFASIVSLPQIDMDLLISHLVVIGFFTWVAGGWARSAILASPVRRAPDALPFQLGMLDVTAALGALNALFLLFVLSQLGWFFGGDAFLRERTGLTAATYARQGFFQMVWVVALVVPVLLISRAALGPARTLRRRHTLLALPVIALLFAIIVSAFLRMRLYVHYYGLTTDRFYPLVFMAWLGVVLAWLALTVLRDRGRPFVGGAVISGAVVLAALNVVAPDALVARVNVARAEQARQSDLDVAYLASLGGEAVETAVRATSAPVRAPAGSPRRAIEEGQRCTAAHMLLDRWGPWSRTLYRDGDDGGWRRWNADDYRARRVVAEHAAALREVTHAHCGARPRR